jgi:5'-3' exonuclease
MKPLVDADVLRYEVGSVGEGTPEEGPRSFDYVMEVLDGKIRDICEAVQATEPPTLYLTGKGNFREEVAETKPYKGNRPSEKPFHFDNLTAYMFNQYDTIEVQGMEADDAMCIRQQENLAWRSDGAEEYTLWKEECKTIICTRDKDLRQVQGWHYGWECGAQREYGPVFVTDPGFLLLDTSKKPPKLTGAGEVFFWAQMLTGDSVDNIPGCKGVGPVKAYDVLTQTPPEHYQDAVMDMYQQKKMTEEQFIEMGQLLWMVRELDEGGRPVMWHPR